MGECAHEAEEEADDHSKGISHCCKRGVHNALLQLFFFFFYNFNIMRDYNLIIWLNVYMFLYFSLIFINSFQFNKYNSCIIFYLAVRNFFFIRVCTSLSGILGYFGYFYYIRRVFEFVQRFPQNTVQVNI